MVHPLGDYACQPSDSTVVAHALTACYYMNGAAYTSGQTQSISNSCAKVISLFDQSILLYHKVENYRDWRFQVFNVLMYHTSCVLNTIFT